MPHPDKTAPPFISLHRISLRAADRRFFVNASWTIAEAEHWAVLGPNGAGKSLLLGALAGSTPVVSGDVVYHFAGQSLDDPCAWGNLNPEEDIACISSESYRTLQTHESPYYQFRWYAGAEAASPTVREALLQCYRPGPRKKRAHLHHVVGLLGIAPLLRTHLVHLSHGETQKLLIATALMRQARLLILDDPFGGLDAVARLRLRQIIEQLLAAARTAPEHAPQIIVSATREEDIPEGIGHLLLVDRGRIVAQGPRSAVRFPSAAKTARPIHLPPPRKTPPPPDPIVAIRAATVVYEGRRILDKINWVIRPGEHWALSGPNGAGKTTLLSLILGDNPQCYANDVTVCGMRRGRGESVWDVRKCLGLVSPDLQTHFPGDTTTFECLASGLFSTLGLFQRLTPAQRRLVQAWCEALNLDPVAHEPYRTLSGGDARTALIGRAAINQPPLLIFDEPGQGLDPTGSARVRTLIDALAQRSLCSIIYVSHCREEFPACLTHEFRLDQGQQIKP